MRIKFQYRIPILISIFLIISSTWAVTRVNPTIQQAIGTATTIIGAVAIWIEMKRSKDMAEGEFITSLNESFLCNEDVKGLYKKLVNNEKLNEDDKTAIVEYLTFFETIYILIKREVIDISLVHDLFAYRFFIAINNKDIQRLELVCDAKYYSNIYTLDYIWNQHLKENNITIDNKKSLEEANPEYYNYVKVKSNGKWNKFKTKNSKSVSYQSNS